MGAGFNCNYRCCVVALGFVIAFALLNVIYMVYSLGSFRGLGVIGAIFFRGVGGYNPAVALRHTWWIAERIVVTDICRLCLAVRKSRRAFTNTS